MSGWLRRLATAPSTRPALTIYVAAVLLAWAFAAGYLRGDVALILLGIATALVVIGDLHHEIRTVHGLVNVQHDALLRRIDQLVVTLTQAGVSIPPYDTGSRR